MIMHVYEIINNVSGQSLGGYEADDEQGALDALARDAGYEDDADMCREVPRGPRELRVVLQSVVLQSVERRARRRRVAPVSDDQIRALRSEAGQAGDIKQVNICDRALNGSKRARSECAHVSSGVGSGDGYGDGYGL